LVFAEIQFAVSESSAHFLTHSLTSEQTAGRWLSFPQLVLLRMGKT